MINCWWCLETVALSRPSGNSSTVLNLPVIVQRSFSYPVPVPSSPLIPSASLHVQKQQLGASIHLQLKKTRLFLHSSPHMRKTAVFQSCFSHIICCICAAGLLLLLPFQPSLKVVLLSDVLSADSPSINLIEKAASPLTVLMGPVQSGNSCFSNCKIM